MYLQGLKGIDRNRAMPHYADQGTFFSLSSTKNGDNVDNLISTNMSVLDFCVWLSLPVNSSSEWRKPKGTLEMDGGTSPGSWSCCVSIELRMNTSPLTKRHSFPFQFPSVFWNLCSSAKLSPVFARKCVNGRSKSKKRSIAIINVEGV